MAKQSHVLIAEDEEMAAMALEDYLSSKGYRVTVAADGAAAVDAFEADPADLLLTDIRMPRKDGYALIAELRARQPGLPVVIMTGHSAPDMVTVEPCAARTTVFTKPFKPALLLDAIQASLPAPH